MKTQDSYRFNIMFKASGDDNIRAGELLEQMGNKKAKVVVQALNEFIDAHPDMLDSGLVVLVERQQGMSKDEMREMVREIVMQHMGSLPSEPRPTAATGQDTGPAADSTVDEMLGIIGEFFG